MKILFFTLLVVLGFSFSGCAKKAAAPADDYYDRANDAAKGAHKNF